MHALGIYSSIHSEYILNDVSTESNINLKKMVLYLLHEGQFQKNFVNVLYSNKMLVIII